MSRRVAQAAISLLMLAGLIGLLLDPVSWMRTSSDAYLGMSLHQPFGTNGLGQDLFRRWLASLSQLWTTVIPASVLALALGSLLAFQASALDWLGSLARVLMDLFDSIPALLWLMAMVLVFKQSTALAFVPLALSLWPESARALSRVMTQALSAPSLMATRAIGVPPAKLVRFHLWPMLRPVFWQQGSLLSILALKLAVLFGLLGFGAETANLGHMLDQGLKSARSGHAQELVLALATLFAWSLALIHLSRPHEEDDGKT
jgi:peptide/nickel transport system permease protein